MTWSIDVDLGELEKCREDVKRWVAHYCYPGKHTTTITIELTQKEVFRLLRWWDHSTIFVEGFDSIELKFINEAVTRKAADVLVSSVLDDLRHKHGS